MIIHLILKVLIENQQPQKKNNKVTYYYETSKDSSDLNYLKIIVVSEYGFNTKLDLKIQKMMNQKKVIKILYLS